MLILFLFLFQWFLGSVVCRHLHQELSYTRALRRSLLLCQLKSTHDCEDQTLVIDY